MGAALLFATMLDYKSSISLAVTSFFLAVAFPFGGHPIAIDADGHSWVDFFLFLFAAMGVFYIWTLISLLPCKDTGSTCS